MTQRAARQFAKDEWVAFHCRPAR